MLTLPFINCQQFNSKNYYLSSHSHTNTVICDGNDHPHRYPSICQTVKMNSKTEIKRLQSPFAAKLRKANYLSISIMRLKLTELNLPNPTYEAHCFPQLNIRIKFDRRQDNAQWTVYIWLPWRSNSSRIFKTTKINRDFKKTKHNWNF